MRTLLFLAATGCISSALTATVVQGESEILYPGLRAFVDARIAEFDQISPERRKRLGDLSRYIRQEQSAGQAIQITFVCTHNSRRSQMSELWAMVAALHYDVEGVKAFSGGTACTAFNPRAVAALQRAGFEVVKSSAEANPRYQVSFAQGAEPQTCFSKVYDSEPNPRSNFCAVMVCSQADENCPLIPGSAARIVIPYDDPKIADDTPEESTIYDQRCAQITRELLYAFSLAR